MIILIKITTKTDINHLEKGSNFKVSVCYSNAYVSNFLWKQLFFFVTLCCTTWCVLHIVYPYCYHQCALIAQFMHSKTNWSHIQNIKKPMVIQSWLREYWVEYSIHTIIQSKYGKQETTEQICIPCKMKLRQNETECHHKMPLKRSIRTTKNWTNTKKH